MTSPSESFFRYPTAKSIRPSFLAGDSPSALSRAADPNLRGTGHFNGLARMLPLTSRDAGGAARNRVPPRLRVDVEGSGARDQAHVVEIRAGVAVI
jgi:hypothetical protein